MKLTDLKEEIVDDFEINPEASEYKGCSYKINSISIIQRSSKVTPKKIGQFVTLWKRNKNGETCPLDLSDDFDFVIILCETKSDHGHFLFPKEVLAQKGYITSEKFPGKRGFRVYPNWDKPTSRQAIKTQAWQIKYFKRTLKLKRESLKTRYQEL